MGLLEWGQVNALSLIITFIDLIAVFLSVLLVTSISHAFFVVKSDNVTEMIAWIRWGTFASILLFCLSNIITFAYTVNSQWYFLNHHALGILSISFWALGKVLLYSLFVYGLYQSFRSAPQLRYSRSVFIVLWSIVGVNVIGIIVGCILFITALDVFIFLGILAFVYDIVFSGVLWLLFQKKLQSVK